MIRLSVIIPMYNVEPYVERCIRSLQNQDLPKNTYEIVCINDGSPDNSLGVVQKLSEEFDNICIIDQVNQGVSMARNNGMDIAKGKYLLMIDPDDYVKENTLKERLDILDRNDIDVALTGYIILDVSGEEEYVFDPIHEKNEVLSGIDYFDKYVRGKSEIRDPHRSVAIFYNKDFLDRNKLRYLSGVPYLEDGEFLARVRCLANKVNFINKPFYLRTTRPGSATHSGLFYTERAREGFLNAAKNLKVFRNKCPLEKQKTFLNQPIIHFTLLYIFSFGISNYLKNRKEIKESLKINSLSTLEVKGCSKQYALIGRLYNVSIRYMLGYILLDRFIDSLRIRMKFN
ncbi:glycosyltransferase family 2 protein [Plebeiibacterium marinum]|uniref:Glycosyltransferase n=1 Tax=Plebeiibacterium marinum TaxID=2992111 RepID=A0AAE3MB14_9BACT|nr:glycosyltransferase [Plebeiobacterium marinum]MCW3804151.1 glycosyltransferase [Plebeiobacterium marinum]